MIISAVFGAADQGYNSKQLVRWGKISKLDRSLLTTVPYPARPEHQRCLLMTNHGTILAPHKEVIEEGSDVDHANRR